MRPLTRGAVLQTKMNTQLSLVGAAPVGGVSPVTLAVQLACSSSPAGKARVQALKGVRWVLRSGSFWVGPVGADGVTPLVSEIGKALVFDGRDNEIMRAAFFSGLFGAPFVAELVIEGRAL